MRYHSFIKKRKDGFLHLATGKHEKKFYDLSLRFTDSAEIFGYAHKSTSSKIRRLYASKKRDDTLALFQYDTSALQQKQLNLATFMEASHKQFRSKLGKLYSEIPALRQYSCMLLSEGAWKDALWKLKFLGLSFEKDTADAFVNFSSAAANLLQNSSVVKPASAASAAYCLTFLSDFFYLQSRQNSLTPEKSSPEKISEKASSAEVVFWGAFFPSSALFDVATPGAGPAIILTASGHPLGLGGNRLLFVHKKILADFSADNSAALKLDKAENSAKTDDPALLLLQEIVYAQGAERASLWQFDVYKEAIRYYYHHHGKKRHKALCGLFKSSLSKIEKRGLAKKVEFLHDPSLLSASISLATVKLPECLAEAFVEICPWHAGSRIYRLCVLGIAILFHYNSSKSEENSHIKSEEKEVTFYLALAINAEPSHTKNALDKFLKFLELLSPAGD